MSDLSQQASDYSLHTPAQRFRQGGRHVYSFPLELQTLDRLLPERVNDKVAYEANRPLQPNHAKRIQEYLESQQKWVLGTILLGIDPYAIEFTPYPGQSEDAPVLSGELRLRGDLRDSMRLFDGQHRRRAIGEALKHLSGSSRRQNKLSDLRTESVPIMLYAESSITALRQMFGDAAKSKPIERNTVAQFDQRDAFNLAAENLLAFSEFFAGRIELQRPTVARTSPNLMSINQLSAALKTLEVGNRGRVSKERNDEYLLDVDRLADKAWVWSDEFLPAAREEYDDLLAGEIDNSEIPDWRTKSMAFNAGVLRILAGCYHAWVKDGSEWQPLADYIRGANLEPGRTHGTLLVNAGVVLPGGASPISRVRETDFAIEYIVKEANNAAVA